VMATPPAVDEVLDRTAGWAFFGAEEQDKSRKHAATVPGDVTNCRVRMAFLAASRCPSGLRDLRFTRTNRDALKV
jgi:hypothetical protein